MANFVRHIPGLTLALLIALTSVSMALARGQMRDASGTIILCTGTGLVSVQVDSDGRPIGPMPICPDCALSFVEHVGDVTPLALPDGRILSFSYLFEVALLDGHSPDCVRVRGPPVV